MTSIEQKLRIERTASLILYLKDADPHHAVEVCAKYLTAHRTEGPAAHFWGDLTGEAQLWAACATTPELTAYSIAALERLRRLPLGLTARRRIFWAMWERMPVEDRRAFELKVAA